MSRRVIVTVLLSVALGIVTAAAKFRLSYGAAPPHPAFTMRSVVTDYEPDGTEVVAEETRYAASDGSYRLVTREGGRLVRDSGFAQGRGFFKIDHGRRELIRSGQAGPLRPAEVTSAEALRSDPNFNRVEEVLRRTAYVIRFVSEVTGGVSSELYLVPELGNAPIKVVIFDSRTGRVTHKVEPVSVVLGEPSPADVKVPDYPEKQ
jgi:hypothetical protein